MIKSESYAGKLGYQINKNFYVFFKMLFNLESSIGKSSYIQDSLTKSQPISSSGDWMIKLQLEF